MLHPKIAEYNDSQTASDQEICELLATTICSTLPDVKNKIWHGHPVWFDEGNPIVGYAKRKKCITLLFWSGQSFDEHILKAEGSFKAAQLDFVALEQINLEDLQRLLVKSIEIQWDYKNIVKRKGKLELLK
jgi:hypothetical protein